MKKVWRVVWILPILVLCVAAKAYTFSGEISRIREELRLKYALQRKVLDRMSQCHREPVRVARLGEPAVKKGKLPVQCNYLNCPYDLFGCPGEVGYELRNCVTSTYYWCADYDHDTIYHCVHHEIMTCDVYYAGVYSGQCIQWADPLFDNCNNGTATTSVCSP